MDKSAIVAPFINWKDDWQTDRNTRLCLILAKKAANCCALQTQPVALTILTDILSHGITSITGCCLGKV